MNRLCIHQPASDQFYLKAVKTQCVFKRKEKHPPKKNIIDLNFHKCKKRIIINKNKTSEIQH